MFSPVANSLNIIVDMTESDHPWDFIEESSSEGDSALHGRSGAMVVTPASQIAPGRSWDHISESSSDADGCPLPRPKAKGRPRKEITKFARRLDRPGHPLLCLHDENPIHPTIGHNDWTVDHFYIVGGDAAQVVARCIKSPKLPSDDNENKGFINHFLGHRPRRNIPIGAELLLLSTYHSKFKRVMLSLGAAVYWASRLYWSSLLSRAMADIHGKQRRGLVIISYVQCDETDMGIGVDKRAKCAKSSATKRRKRRKGQRGKIEQTEWSVGMLMEEPGTEKHSAVFGEIPCPLQHGDSNQAETLRAMLRRQLDFPLLDGMQSMFKYCFKVSTMDRASSNLKFQQSEQDENQSVCTVFLGLFCAVHVVHTAFGLGLLDLNRIVSGAISLSFVM